MLAFLVEPNLQLVEFEFDELLARLLEGTVREAMGRCRNEHPGTPLWGLVWGLFRGQFRGPCDCGSHIAPNPD